LALVVGHPAHTGGMETFCRFIAQAALTAGWRITVALSGENIYRPLQQTHSHVVMIDQVDWLDETCAGDRQYDWRRICRRAQWFRALRPDAALFVQSSNTPFRASIAGAKLAGVPVITTHRTMPWPPETVPSRRHMFGLLPGIGLHRRRVVLKTWLTGFLAARIVYNSSQVRSGYESLYRYASHKGTVIPNAVAVPATASQTIGPQDTTLRTTSRVTVGYAGRLGSDKRLDILLRAVASVRSAERLRIVLYGEGAEKPSLAALAADLGIVDRIEWRGVTETSEALYREMDIVVLCSPRESSSNMVLEAMAAGKAVVVTATGGMPELVAGGRCGICVPPLDVAALAETLEVLAFDAPLRRRLGESARLKAMNEHDPQLIARQWMTMLTEVAAKRIGFSAPVLSDRWSPPAKLLSRPVYESCLSATSHQSLAALDPRRTE